MELGLGGRVALVAGSSRGLGLAVARELAAEGADLVLCARGADRLREARDSIHEGHGVEVLDVPTDLTEADQVARLVGAALDRFGRVDILLVNAGGPPRGAFVDHTLEDWRDATRLTLESARNLVAGVLPGMLERGWGRIVAITSVAVKEPVDGLILSSSLRAAVTGMLRTLANEVAERGVTVNCVLPGFTRTDRLRELAEGQAEERDVQSSDVLREWERTIPAGRLAEPREVAGLVAFLASERAAYVTGQSIAVDGGRTRALL